MSNDPTPATTAERCQIAVTEFMRDWNILPPEQCATRMFARLKTELARMEREDANAE